MTRISKVLFLIIKGEEIVYEKKGSHTYVLAIKQDDGTWERFTKKSEDQKEAGRLIDLLYWEWTK